MVSETHITQIQFAWVFIGDVFGNDIIKPAHLLLSCIDFQVLTLCVVEITHELGAYAFDFVYGHSLFILTSTPVLALRCFSEHLLWRPLTNHIGVVARWIVNNLRHFAKLDGAALLTASLSILLAT